MMMFQEAQDRAKASQDQAKTAQDQAKVANKVSLQVGKDNDTAQKELQELQRVMEPKRARTHVATVDDDEECEKQSCDDWELPDHRREATHIQNRRSIMDCVLESWKQCACSQNYCRTHSQARHDRQRVRDTDTMPMTRETDTNGKIVMLMKAALDETKHCRNE